MIYKTLKQTVLVAMLVLITSFSWSQTKEVSGTFNSVQPQQIDFLNLSFDQLKVKAKKEKKAIFLNLSMSNCIPCREMERNVFTDFSVANYYNPNFINASVDYHKSEGQIISELYQTNCAPTYLFINSEGRVVHRKTGYLSPEEFVKLAEIANDPKRNMAYYEDEYQRKKTDPEFLLRYLYILDEANCMRLSESLPFGEDIEMSLKRDTLVNEYFASQKEDLLLNKTNWEAIRNFTTDYRSREFMYLLKNATAYKKLYSEEVVNKKIREVIGSGKALFLGQTKGTEAKTLAYIKEIQNLNFPETEAGVFWLMLNDARWNSQWQEFMRLINESGSKYIIHANDKESVSKTIYEHIEDKEALQKAEELMQSAVEEQPSWLTYETYANVLLLQNKKEKAKSMALKALEIAQQIGAKKDNYNSITYLLEKIEGQE